MYAVIKTGGKQYKVAANDTITLGKLPGAAGEVIQFPEVLMVGGEAGVTVGAPMVSGAAVTAEILDHKRGRKVISFKKRRRQNSKRRKGHRQDYTVVRIAEILTGGAKSALTAKAAAKPAAKPAPAAKAETPAAGALDTSNLSLISGVGPTIEKKLIAAGVTTWNQIAAWTEADLAKFDEELKLRGRATREEWIEQAKELLAGKPPRAKVDQEEQKHGG